MAFALGALLYQAYDTAGTLNDRDLNLRATDPARYVVLGLTIQFLPAVGGPREAALAEAASM